MILEILVFLDCKRCENQEVCCQESMLLKESRGCGWKTVFSGQKDKKVRVLSYIEGSLKRLGM